MITAVVKDIMTREFVFVSKYTSLFEAAQLMRKHGFAGLPVVDSEGKIIGIITEYYIIKGVAKSLPAFKKIFKNISFEDIQDNIKVDDIKTLTNIMVGDSMNTDPLTVTEDSSFEEVLKFFAEHHSVNPIPVVDSSKHVIGIISRYDVIKLFNALA